MRHIRTEPVSPVFRGNKEKDRAIRYLFYLWVTLLVLLFMIAYLAATTDRAHAEEVKTVPCEIWVGKRVFGIMSISRNVIFDMPVKNATTVGGIWAELMSDNHETAEAIQKAMVSLQKDMNSRAKRFNKGGFRCKADNGMLEFTITLHRTE